MASSETFAEGNGRSALLQGLGVLQLESPVEIFHCAETVVLGAFGETEVPVNENLRNSSIDSSWFRQAR